MTEISVIDYGLGNLLSVRRALEYCGANVEIADSPDAIMRARKLILPGVGAFRDGMNELVSRGMDKLIIDTARRGTPIMGICLGMQMLFDASEEFGTTAGLGLIKGRVVRIASERMLGVKLKVPHIGWAPLSPSSASVWETTILENILPGEAAYFVHSFTAVPDKISDCLAECNYEGIKLSAVVQSENISGCQFHPEKSADVGLRILKRFLSI